MKSKSVLKREAVQKGEPIPQDTAVSKSVSVQGLSCAWISTEERLPEKDQIVLWWNEQSNMVELGSWNYARGEIITHWMPTPKPPQAR